MKFAGLIFSLTLFAALHLGAAEYKVAGFDMRKVFSEWQYSVESKKKIEETRAQLEEENNARLATINQLQMQRTKLHQEYKQNAASMTPDQQRKMDDEFRSMGRDAMALEQDRRDFFSRGRRMLSNKIKSEANIIIDHIIQEAQLYALEKKFTMVLESGGETTTNTPFFLYVDGMVDITDELIKRLNAKKPSDS